MISKSISSLLKHKKYSKKTEFIKKLNEKYLESHKDYSSKLLDKIDKTEKYLINHSSNNFKVIQNMVSNSNSKHTYMLNDIKEDLEYKLDKIGVHLENQKNYNSELLKKINKLEEEPNIIKQLQHGIYGVIVVSCFLVLGYFCLLFR